MANLFKCNNGKKIFVSILLLVVAMFSFTLLGCSKASSDKTSSDKASSETSSNEVDYGEKLTFLEKNEIYYTSNVTKAQVEALGNYLVKGGMLTKDKELTILLDKENGDYQFKMPIKDGLENDDETIAMMKEFCKELSVNVFKNESVDVLLCDENFNTLRTVVNLE